MIECLSRTEVETCPFYGARLTLQSALLQYCVKVAPSPKRNAFQSAWGQIAPPPCGFHRPRTHLETFTGSSPCLKILSSSKPLLLCVSVGEHSEAQNCAGSPPSFQTEHPCVLTTADGPLCAGRIRQRGCRKRSISAKVISDLERQKFRVSD